MGSVGWAEGSGSKSMGMCSCESEEKILFHANNQLSCSGERGLYFRERPYSFCSREELSPQTHEIRTVAVYVCTLQFVFPKWNTSAVYAASDSNCDPIVSNTRLYAPCILKTFWQQKCTHISKIGEGS